MDAFWCVVPAAGRGRRAGGDRPKQHQAIDGRTLLDHTLARLAGHPRVAGIVVVLDADDAYWTGIDAIGGRPVLTVVGGAERADSVLAGLAALGDQVPDDDFVLVHDAARPCVRHADIDRLLARAVPAGGGLLGAPLRDTLKHVGEDGRSQGTEPRERRWRVFTPQVFRRGELTAALLRARHDGVVVSDEAMAMERAGFAPLLVEGAEDNIKVTTSADFALAQFLIGRTA
jgi:2-C-methyl-D-erythritol 4-phosphate cytidylyltransferase